MKIWLPKGHVKFKGQVEKDNCKKETGEVSFKNFLTKKFFKSWMRD